MRPGNSHRGFLAIDQRAVVLLIAGSLFVAASVASAQTAPSTRTTQPSDAALLRIKSGESLRVQRELAPLKDLGVLDGADALHVWVQDGLLVASTPIEPGDGGVHFTLRGGTGDVELTGIGAGGQGNAVTRGFSFLYQDASRPDNVMTTIQILASSAISQFNCTDDSLATTLTVQLIELRRAGGPAITLRVDRTASEWSGAATPSATLVNVSANSFTSLRADHPDAADEYVRPMFRAVGAEASVFAVDRTTAWLALSDSFVVDAAMRKKIEDILPRLGDDQFAVRDAASADLAATGVDGALTIRALMPQRLSLEQQFRVDSFLRPYMTAVPTGAATSRNFLLDCLYTDDAALRTVVLARLSALCGVPVAWRPARDTAARDAQIEQLRAALSPTTKSSGSSR